MPPLPSGTGKYTTHRPSGSIECPLADNAALGHHNVALGWYISFYLSGRGGILYQCSVTWFSLPNRVLMDGGTKVQQSTDCWGRKRAGAAARCPPPNQQPSSSQQPQPRPEATKRTMDQRGFPRRQNREWEKLFLLHCCVMRYIEQDGI